MDGNTAFAAQYRAWEKFISIGEIDSEIVRDEVARSWKRCVDAALDHRAPAASVRLNPDELSKLLITNRSYIEAAVPAMSFPQSAVRGTGFILVLTDASGIVLEVFGDADVIERARANNYVPGCCRSEEEVGTNSIGLVIREKSAIHLSGPEHYNVLHHSWTCASAPVFGPDGTLLGTVTLSGQSMNVHRHTLGMVISTADAIENRLREQQMKLEKWRSEKLTESLLRWTNDAVVTIGADGKIAHVNKIAETLLGCTEAMLESRDAASVFSAPEIAGIMKSKSELSPFETSYKLNGVQDLFFVRPYVMHGNDGVIGAILALNRRDAVKQAKSSPQHAARYTFSDIIGVHENFRRPLELAKLLAQQETRILITGETGTGKELIAHSIHSASSRAQGPFVPINCAAIPRELLEAELFGYKEGAFTGARRSGQIGKIELANCGTLFLDEISLMPLDLQAKLLRVLEDGIITRLGDSTPIKVNLRIVAATNDNLYEMSNNGSFRKDLYFRLSVAEVRLPPLRERADDIIPLCEFILERLCKKMNRTRVTLSAEAVHCLIRYPWPGNIRELENALEISILMNLEGVIYPNHLPQRLQEFSPPAAVKPASETFLVTSAPLSDIEGDVIRNALRDHNGNVARTARVLGISRSTIYRKLREYNADSAEQLHECRAAGDT